MYLSGLAPSAAVQVHAQEPPLPYTCHNSCPPVLTAVFPCQVTPVELWLAVTVAAVSLSQKCVQ